MLRQVHAVIAGLLGAGRIHRDTHRAAVVPMRGPIGIGQHLEFNRDDAGDVVLQVFDGLPRALRYQFRIPAREWCTIFGLLCADPADLPGRYMILRQLHDG